MGKRRLGKRRLVATQREAWGRLVPESRKMSDGGVREGLSSRLGVVRVVSSSRSGKVRSGQECVVIVRGVDGGNSIHSPLA